MQLTCPWCGPRNVSEFHHRGELVPRPEPASTTPEQWRDYLYFRSNTPGWAAETWYHARGCRRFMTVERNSLTNQVRPGSGGTSARGPERPAEPRGRR